MFQLELHPDKSRFLRFGRFAAAQRKEKGESGEPQSLNFLGLMHCCSRSRSGLFVLLRHTMRSHLTAKVHEISLELRGRLHEPIVSQGKWLVAVLRGHYAYYGVATNIEALDVFRSEVTHCWFKSLRRRSQRRRLNWTRMNCAVDAMSATFTLCIAQPPAAVSRVADDNQVVRVSHCTTHTRSFVCWLESPRSGRAYGRLNESCELPLCRFWRSLNT